jgi:pimeloyl-ACP methyl ester carboxylesterase
MRKAILFIVMAALSPGAMAQPGPDIYAKPQQRVALPGGRTINLVCVGQGSPVVILTAGAGDWSEHWQFVQDPIAQRTRVCAWDRAGFGYSDASNAPQSAAATEDDLEKTLSSAHVAGPYLLVAHSAGSYETLLFADRHPQEIAGMVLVDPSLPAMVRQIEAVSPLAAKVARMDVANRVRAFRSCASNPAQITAADAAICFHFSESAKSFAAGLEPLEHQPQRLETKASLYEQFEASMNQADKASRNYGAIPITVLTSEKQPLAALPVEQPDKTKALADLWMSGHDQLAALSTNGTNQVIPGTDHQIPIERPDTVIAATLHILDAYQHAR